MFYIPAKKQIQQEQHVQPFVCSCCKSEFTSQSGNFYYTKSELYKGNNNYSNICIPCIHRKFKSVESQTESSRAALIVVCHLLDIYYSEKIFNNMVSQDMFNLGKYLNSFNGKQWAGKTFSSNLLQNDFARVIEFDDDNIPVKEDASDIKNRTYCIAQIGYDPFVDNTPADRKFLFNTLADYLTDDIIEDPHRLQSVIPLVRSILQESKLDRSIDAEQKSKIPDMDRIKQGIDSKDKIRRVINQTANDNGLSVKGSGRSSRGASTLTGIMREMAENNFEEIKVNLFDVKMNGTFRNISDISNKSLFDQLNYQSDDYARMVANQRDIILRNEDEKQKLEENLRIAKLELKKLKEQANSDSP